MSLDRDEWERLDAPAVTPDHPRSAWSDASGRPARGRRRARLRRSRRPSLAALDGGAEVFQRRLRDVMIGATIILVPAVALNVWVTVLVFDRLDPNRPSFVPDDTGAGIEDLGTWTAAVFASFVTAVVGYFAAQILFGERFGDPVSLNVALGRTLRRLPAILTAWAVTHWWFPLFALLVVTSEVELVIVWLVLGAIPCWLAAAATLLVIPAMVGERLGPLAASRRSLRLARLRYGVCATFLLLATALAVLLAVGIGTLIPLLEATGFLTLGSATPIVQGVMAQLVVLVVVPLIALSTAQVYLEVRVAGEGLDLAIEADAAFGPNPIVPSP